jgi:hypothetical protein
MGKDDSCYKMKCVKKEKSLWILSGGFINLLMEWQSVISLEQAAKKLSTGNANRNVWSCFFRSEDLMT